MPQMADIIVKKADETTNITYVQTVPSAGDKSPAVWKCTSVGSAPGFNPILKVTARDNQAKTARRVEIDYAYPITATASDGSISIVDTIRFQGSWIVATRVAQTSIDEAIAQSANLVASTLVKSMGKSGYSAT